VIEYGNPRWKVAIPFNCQFPKATSTTFGVLLRKRLPRPIVHTTGNHAMVDVEVRQAAIESCIVIVDCSLVATARISNAGGGRFLVDCLRPGIHTGQGQ
jgi:hypothetical protein